ncbi:PE-PGRS family protein [Streptomyces sp. NBC_00233]|uniref:PE-PGRS family protein n=1 Tax=Streptomyces sp. NBC_00233 TaxID=2975686 RepID=UPI0022536537|nr:PE-PGRS family protein [Streptomyces sp. NBC_00233]MCX5231518.1 PE-PGRS family protein [Streptomyces sp. NBC_00233]
MTGGREKLVERLRQAGLDVVEGDRVEEVVRPWAAWRPVVSANTTPTVAVRTDTPELVAELNRQWYRLAVELGIIGADGAFLIHVAGGVSGGTSRRWTRVRLTERWDLAGVLGERPGRPEFVTLSTDGDALIGATTEEYDVWLVALDRLKERQEAEARAAGNETAEARAAAWERLFRGPVSMQVRDEWAHGLAHNPATSEDLRAGLLGLTHHLLWHALPAPVVEAAMAHPEWQVRALLAEVQPNITAEQWERLILGEQDARRRWVLTLLAADRRVELTGTAYARLAVDPSAKTRHEAARLTGLPAHLLAVLARDVDPSVRASACRGTAWSQLDSPLRRALLDDPDGKVRVAARLRHHQEHPLSRSAYDSEGLGTSDAVRNCRLERDLAEHLAHHGDPSRRSDLAGNPWLDSDLVAVLAQDPEEGVRFAVSTRPDLTEEQRAGVAIDFDPSTRSYALGWVRALHDDPDAMRRLGASSHPLVRRSVARARRLPPDVVESLARDEDRVVQLFLAESCDDAPAEMLMRVWQWWNGSLSAPDRPRGHPNFPRRDLVRHADDPNPRMRQLALDDPESTVELVERLSRDGNEEVRLRAATDARLTPASAVRLLDDPYEQVRRAAARHPRLPARVLLPLLRNKDTAYAAAQNPGLPEPVIARMIQLMQRLRAEAGGGGGAGTGGEGERPAVAHAADARAGTEAGADDDAEASAPPVHDPYAPSE